MAFWVRLNLLCLFLDTDIKFRSRDIFDRIMPWTFNDDHDDGYCEDYCWTTTP